MKKELPDIYHYNDYRKFLKDYQNSRKIYDKSFSMSNICKLLGLPNTRSYFADILKGKKMTSAFIKRFIDLLNLKPDEAQYFTVMVKFNQAEISHERDLYFEQLLSLNKTPKKVLSLDMFEYYSNWYNSAIRAVLNLYDFSGNYKELCKKVFPNITIKQARASIRLLKKLKLIEKGCDGIYRLTNNSITTPEFIKSDLIKQYQMSLIELAKSSVINNDEFPQIIASNTISISESGYKRLEKKVDKFRSEIRSLVHKDEEPADNVYQLNLQLFPMSKGVQ